ncbi:MAG TPA: tRNA pseudouridine synthase A [Flavisolibacter sp.]|nr:tRNA pseudouridine synthase A [Flavisolibacter sp.]
MSRYFIELAYKGTKYSGFQIQENANTIQSEVEEAFQTIQRKPVKLTGSSRTDAGVHAIQNYFHFDFANEIHSQLVYKMNSILSADIVIKHIYLMNSQAHSRFDAISREYDYKLHSLKNPFIQDVSFYFPYKLDKDLIFRAIEIIKMQDNFFGFAKSNSQVKNYKCKIEKCEWKEEGAEMIFTIKANRFLRGMVRLLTASVLKVGRGKMMIDEFEKLFDGISKCVYSVPAHGLFLREVCFPENYFPLTDMDLR